MTTKKVRYIVQCNNCGVQYENWSGSTPCCGSLSTIIEDYRTPQIHSDPAGEPKKEKWGMWDECMYWDKVYADADKMVIDTSLAKTEGRPTTEEILQATKDVAASREQKQVNLNDFCAGIHFGLNYKPSIPQTGRTYTEGEADNLAISFAEWLMEWDYNWTEGRKWRISPRSNPKDTEQLLREYLKQNPKP